MPTTYYTEEEVNQILERMRKAIYSKFANMQINETGQTASGIYKCKLALREVSTQARKYHS